MRLIQLWYNERANCILIVDTSKPKKACERLQLETEDGVLDNLFSEGWHDGSLNGSFQNNTSPAILIDSWFEK